MIELIQEIYLESWGEHTWSAIQLLNHATERLEKSSLSNEIKEWITNEIIQAIAPLLNQDEVKEDINIV